MSNLIKISFIILIIIPGLVLSDEANLKSERNNIIKCSAYHLKAMLNSQYYNKEKYVYLSLIHI